MNFLRIKTKINLQKVTKIIKYDGLRQTFIKDSLLTLRQQTVFYEITIYMYFCEWNIFSFCNEAFAWGFLVYPRHP